MLGYYDYTVWLTYISLMTSVIGMFLTFHGYAQWAIGCLALSGLLDAFDGKVARTKKNRTREEKSFGIQIDSLCDIVCFGIFPAIICYHSGMVSLPSMLILCFYCLAGLIRLAYFNVLEEKRQQETAENRKYYQGLPITTIAVILPLTYISSTFLRQNFLPVLNVVMLLTGFLFIKKFKVRKPGNRQLALMIGIVAAAVVYLMIHYEWKGHFGWNWKSLLDMFSM